METPVESPASRASELNLLLGDLMPSNNNATTKDVIQAIRELARLSADLADTVCDIHVELIRLREQLGIEESRIKKIVARPTAHAPAKPN